VKRKIISILIVLGLMVGLTAIPAQAATTEEIEGAVEGGVTWLVAQQNPDGSWGVGNTVARTGFAVVKLEDRAFELDYESPFDPEYPYSDNVIAGLDYIFRQASEDDCGIHFGWGTYDTGIAMMAIAAGRDTDRVVVVVNPVVNGLTYGEVLESNVAYFAASQTPLGGWSYACGEEGTDNSNSGYAVLGLRYAETAGIGIPQSLKDNLSDWIDYIQNDVNGDPNDGGSGYEHPDSWVNLLKTGNLLFEMAFVDDTVDTPRVQDAIDYIERHWDDTGTGSLYDTGWNNPPHYQAMYCLMKGLEAFNIQTIEVDGIPIDWFDEMSTAIVTTQNIPPGNWPAGHWGDELLSTLWALLTLERVVPPHDVAVDIKPMSCPNPLNVNSKGVLPVAILGTEDFDVTMVDPASVRLEGVVPLRWALEDVATPYEPFTGKQDCYDCNELGLDGYLDLTLKFDKQEIVAALGAVNDGDCVVVQLTGNLMEEYGATPIVGEDVVLIVKKK